MYCRTDEQLTARVRQLGFLDNFGLLSKYGNVNWPARSPDLSPPDVFL